MPRKRLFQFVTLLFVLFSAIGGTGLFKDHTRTPGEEYTVSVSLFPSFADPAPFYQTALEKLGLDECSSALGGVLPAKAGCTEVCRNVCILELPSPPNARCPPSCVCVAWERRCHQECTDEPPTVSGSVQCNGSTVNGWCTGTSTLNMTANELQNYPVTIAGIIDGAPFTCAVGTSCSKALPQGSGTLQFWATSAAGTSATLTRSWARDATPPTLSYAASGTTGNAGWYLSPVTVTLNGGDAHSGVASEEIGSSGANAATLTEGVHTLSFSVTDVAGHSTTSTATLKIDTTDPTLSIAVDQSPNAAGWYTTAPQLSVSGSDALSGVASEKIRVDGGTAQNSPVALADGTHTVVYTVEDVAGNQVSQTRNYKVDTAAPILSPQFNLASPDGKNGWYAQPVDVDLVASDAVSGLSDKTVEVDGSAVGSLPVELSDGTYTLTFSGTDLAGNHSSLTRNVKVDTTLPAISVSVDHNPNMTGWYSDLPTLSLTGSDAVSGLETEMISVDGGTAQSNPVTLTEGIHTVVYTVEDVAGNLSSETREYKIDITPPEAVLVEPAQDGNAGWHRSAPTVRVLNADSLSGVDTVLYRLNGGAWQNGDQVTLAEGVFDVDFRVKDTAGNETLVQKTIRVDLTEPVSAFTSHTNGDVVAGIVTLEGKTTDATSGPAPNGEISFDNGTNWQPITLDNAGNWSTIWNAYELPNGDYTLLMRGEDIAGNPEHTAILTLTVRNTPPTVELKPGTWTISDSGTLKISETGIEIARVSLVFRDLEGRYPQQKIELRPNPMSGIVSWDRRFGDGTIAPWGTYEVMVVACDIFDNCARDISSITIPFYTLTTPTPTASPAPTVTPTSPPKGPTKPPGAQNRVLQPIPSTPEPLPTLPPLPPAPPADYSQFIQRGLTISATLGYFLLLLTLLLAVDPRPKALHQLSKTGRIYIDLHTKEKE